MKPTVPAKVLCQKLSRFQSCIDD